MSKPLHTPGPWIVDLNRDFLLGCDAVSVEATTPDGKYITREICTLLVDTDSHPDGPEWLEDSANARLVAAAPELLAEAEKDLEILIDLQQNHLFGSAAVVRALVQKRIEGTQAAVNKAKGEQT